MAKRTEDLLGKIEHLTKRLNEAAMKVLGEEELAEDVTQETFEYFCTKDIPADCDDEVEKYLVTSATNRAKRMKKKMDTTTFVDLNEAEDYEAEDCNDAELRELQYVVMHQCINALEMVEKRLFKLRYVKGLGVKTVARMMNMSEDRVRKLSKKTMNKVTEMVKDERRKDERKNRWC